MDTRSGDRQRKRHGMTNTRFRNFSSARRCHNLSSRKEEKKKKKRKRMKEPRQRESYSSSSYVSLISSWSLRSLIRKLVSLKDSRARWCDGPATVPTEYDKHEGTEWVFRFLGLFSLSLSLSLSHNLNARQTSHAIKGWWDLSSLLSRLNSHIFLSFFSRYRRNISFRRR